MSAGGEAVLSDAQRVRAGVEESLNRSVAAGQRFLATINGQQATAIQSSLQLAEAVKAVDVQNQASVASWIKSKNEALAYAESVGVLAETEHHLSAATQQLILDQQQYQSYLKKSASAQDAAGAAAGGHGLQLGRLRMELGTLVGRITGTNTALDRMAGAIGSMSAGDGLTIGVLAGIAAIGYAYEKLTGQTKQAREEQENATKALHEWFKEQQNGPGGKLAGNVATSQKVLDEQKARLAGLKAFADAEAAAELHPGPLAISQSQEPMAAVYANSVHKAADDAQKAYEDFKKIVNAGESEVNRLFVDAGRKAQSQRASDLAGLVASDHATAAERTEAVNLLKADTTLLAQLAGEAAKGYDRSAATIAQRVQLTGDVQKLTSSLNPNSADTSDINRLSALSDQINRLHQEAASFGKDASVTSRISGITDAIDRMQTSFEHQAATGKISTTALAQYTGKIDELRSSARQAGVELQGAFDKKIGDQIHEQYTAEKALFDSMSAGTGSVHELTAAKQAELEISRVRVQLGHDLTDQMRQDIINTKQLAVATSEAATTQGMQQRLDALLQENEAMRAGESTRATYAINQRADLEITKALTLSTVDLAAARILVVNATRAAELAHLGLANAEKQGQHATAELLKEQRELAKVFEQDLVRAIEQFTTRGLSSFTDFFGEIQRLSLQMVAQIDNSMRKIHDATEESIYSGSDSEFGKLSSESDRLGGLRKTAGYAATVISAGTAGYNIGSQSGSYTTGAIGGAASGAALGASIAGPWGAVIGGVTGLVSGLWGAHDKLKELRKQYEQTEGNFIKNLTGYASSYAQQFDSIGQSLKDLQDAAEKAHTTVSPEAQRAAAIAQGKITTDFLGDLTQRLNALHGAAGDAANQIDALNKKHQEDLETIKALGLGTEATTRADKVWLDSINAVGAAQEDAAAALRTQENMAAWAAIEANTQQMLGIQQAAARDAQVVAQQQLDVQSQMLSTAQNQLSSLQDAAKNTQQTVDALTKYGSSLLLSSNTTLSPMEQYAEAKRQLDAIASAARGGDQDAARNLPDIANQFLQLSKTMFATTSPFGSDFDYVQSLVNGLTDKYTDQLTSDQIAIAIAERSLAIQQQQLDQLKLLTGTSGGSSAANAEPRRAPDWMQPEYLKTLPSQLSQLIPGLDGGSFAPGTTYNDLLKNGTISQDQFNGAFGLSGDWRNGMKGQYDDYVKQATSGWAGVQGYNNPVWARDEKGDLLYDRSDPNNVHPYQVQQWYNNPSYAGPPQSFDDWINQNSPLAAQVGAKGIPNDIVDGTRGVGSNPITSMGTGINRIANGVDRLNATTVKGNDESKAALQRLADRLAGLEKKAFFADRGGGTG